LIKYSNTLTSLMDYPSGLEIKQSLLAIEKFLNYDQLAQLPLAQHELVGLAINQATLRPAVIQSLFRLRDIGLEVLTYTTSTSRVNKIAALSRATDALDQLDQYVEAEVGLPEQNLLRTIISQWRRLIIQAGGSEGRSLIAGPVANPYVVGNPVTGDLFKGREEIMIRLEELWRAPTQCPSVVIYGHRRMGKSSILNNLTGRFGPQTIIVNFNMQRVGMVDNTGELLHNLALALYDNLPPAQQTNLIEPPAERFLTANPYMAFDRYLIEINPHRPSEQRFIITIDEFEIIERLIKEEKLESRILDYWRGLIQTYPWFVLAFAGLHTLQEMTQDYWNPLFGSVTKIPVAFLNPKAAERLLVQPSPDFDLDYAPDAIALVIALTNGQPYLIQLIGHTLITLFNRQTYEEGLERERRFTAADIEQVINSPEFYRDGNAYFTGVWAQAQETPPGQTEILKILSREPLTLPQLTAQKLNPDALQDALTTLKEHDVIILKDDHYHFTVELMRRWVADLQPS